MHASHLQLTCLCLGGGHLPHRICDLLIHLAELGHGLLLVAQLRLLDLADLVLRCGSEKGDEQ